MVFFFVYFNIWQKKNKKKIIANFEDSLKSIRLLNFFLGRKACGVIFLITKVYSVTTWHKSELRIKIHLRRVWQKESKYTLKFGQTNIGHFQYHKWHPSPTLPLLTLSLLDFYSTSSLMSSYLSCTFILPFTYFYPPFPVFLSSLSFTFILPLLKFCPLSCTTIILFLYFYTPFCVLLSPLSCIFILPLLYCYPPSSEILSPSSVLLSFLSCTIIILILYFCPPLL